MSMAMTVSFQMTADEVVRSGFRRKLSRPRFVLSIVVLLAIGVVVLAAGGPAAYLGALCIAYAAFAPAWLYLAIRRLVRQWPWLTAPTTLTFGQAGFSLSAADRRFEIAWSGIRSWARTERHLLLYLDAGSTAVTIPRRAFSPQALQEFLGHVATTSERNAA